MKKFLSIALVLVLIVGCFAACGTKTEPSTTTESAAPSSEAASGETIKVGIIGCHTGEYAPYRPRV